MSEFNRQRILEAAESYSGVPYALPPDGVNTLDCSLFVLYTYRDAGYSFPRGVRTAEQIRQVCTLIDVDDVQPGDLLFFEHTYEPGESPGPDGKVASHIGISLGKGSGRMWDAQETASRNGVGITNIHTNYWQTHFLHQAGRFIPTILPPPDLEDKKLFVVSGVGMDGLNIREYPSTEAKIVDNLPDETLVVGEEYSWRKIKARGVEGWAADMYLDPKERNND